MGAGIIDLLFIGAQNAMLSWNPEITYFKKIYKRHSNFSMEPIRVELNRTDVNMYDNTIFIVKIPRHADLISQIYLKLTLPDIISDNVLAFRWIENVAECLINNYYITIGGNKVDQQTGDFIHVINQLSLNKDKRELYDKMTGNVLQLTNPGQYNLQNSDLSDPPFKYRIGDTYPSVLSPLTLPLGDVDNFMPSIPSRTIYIPLYLWFNREIGNALPLVSLQYSEVQLVIETNPLSMLYKVFYNINGVEDHFAPNLGIQAHRLENFITNARQTFIVSNTVLDIKASLECNYIYLDTVERNYFAYKPLEYLIEQVNRIEENKLSSTNIINFVLQNPVKELIWYCRRDNINVKNDWFNYLDVYGSNIMKTAKIMFNGIDRIDIKEAEYFNWLQPFQHHTGNAKQGLMCYSFSISPEDYQPSGCVNMSRINNIQFYMTIKNPIDSSYSYDAIFFAINYNFLTISSGLGGTKFSS
jgi:hypothetical protein